MFSITRTTAADHDFIELVRQLDAELAIRDGAEHGFYDTFNKLDSIKHVIILKDNDIAIACGAIKPYDEKTMEVKRMFTLPAHRGRAIAAQVLAALEAWATELGYERTILETGKKQPEAIRLYEKNNYTRIPNYGQYAGVDNSVCFEKALSVK